MSNLANDNLTHHVGIYEASPYRRYSLTTTRNFTGADAHEVKRPKSNRVVQVPEDTFEQWAWDRLTSRALVILNAHRFLASWTDEESGEVHEDTWATIDAQSLTQRLLAVFWTEAGDRIDNDDDGYNQKHPNTITQEHMESMVQRVATHQRDIWNWQALSDRGRKGGKASKRPQKVTAQMILALPFLEHSSPEAQKRAAAVLGCTKRTVEKRLAEFRAGESVFTWTGETAYRSLMPEVQQRPEALFSVEELAQRKSAPAVMDEDTFNALLEPAYRSLMPAVEQPDFWAALMAHKVGDSWDWVPEPKKPLVPRTVRMAPFAVPLRSEEPYQPLEPDYDAGTTKDLQAWLDEQLQAA